ncbi:MAG: saccharopine dehydrogenase NADP-binding domain-containing protein [Gemmataceae bacterium]|nr:saccharopine dehydrogenase NADP-binding domain-containing protein [Gemmataceae bacterium]
MTNPRIVILGGYGTFGSLIADQLAPSGAQLYIAGRDASKGNVFADSIHAQFIHCDARNTDALRDTISGKYLLINAAGPFQAKDYSIPRACIEHGCHYIDLGDGREYVAGIRQLDDSARAKGAFVCVGASTTPAVTSAAAAELCRHFRRIGSIKVALSAGNRNQAGVSTIASILAYVGLPVRIWQGGRWRQKTGWEMGEFFDFPKPVGRRRVQLCDVPDLALFPSMFQAENVVFKAGVELTLFNYAIGVLGLLRKLRPASNMSALAQLLVWFSRLFKSLGTTHGSFAVSVTGDSGAEKSLAFVAPQNGPRVPSAPALLLARNVLAHGIPAAGAFPCVGFISLAQFAEYLAPFGIFVVRGENGSWSSA